MSAKVDILIMAAGGSRRFGSCKLLADFRGAPLLAYALGAATEISRSHSEFISSINLVLGGYAAEIRAALAQWPFSVNILHCPDWAMGLGHSLAYGVGQLPAENSVLIVLGDQPLVSAEALGRLLKAAKENPGKIVCAEFASTIGVPAIFPETYKRQLLQLSGDRGAKSILIDEQSSVAGVRMRDAAVDIDTPHDLLINKTE